MKHLLNKYLLSTAILRNAEGGGSGGGDGGAPAGDGGAAAASPESVLFPDEGKGGDDKSGGDGKQADPTAGQSDWKEYEPDPNKSAEENAAAKAEHDKTKPAEGDGKDKSDPANQVPEDGKYTLTMPDGVEIDAELAAALGPDFKELGLTNGQAQKLVDKYIEVQTKRGETRAKEWGETVQKWADDAKADKEIGGDKFDTTVKNAQRFLNTHATQELRDYLNASGGGNHPELIRVFAKAGELIREDNPATGGVEGRGKPADPAHVLFPNDAPKG